MAPGLPEELLLLSPGGRGHHRSILAPGVMPFHSHLPIALQTVFTCLTITFMQNIINSLFSASWWTLFLFLFYIVLTNPDGPLSNLLVNSFRGEGW